MTPTAHFGEERHSTNNADEMAARECVYSIRERSTATQTHTPCTSGSKRPRMCQTSHSRLRKREGLTRWFWTMVSVGYCLSHHSALSSDSTSTSGQRVRIHTAVDGYTPNSRVPTLGAQPKWHQQQARFPQFPSLLATNSQLCHRFATWQRISRLQISFPAPCVPRSFLFCHFRRRKRISKLATNSETGNKFAIARGECLGKSSGSYLMAPTKPC